MAPGIAFVPATSARLALSTGTTSPAVIDRVIPTSFRPLVSPLRRAEIVSDPGSPPAPGAQPSRILFWFHTDLRVDDNPALRAAASSAAVPGGAFVPVAAGAASDAAAAPLVAELKACMERLGSGLLLAPGRAETTLVGICRRLKLTAVYWNRSVFKAHVATEARVLRALSEAGLRAETFWGNALSAPSDEALQAKKGEEMTARKLGRGLGQGVEAPVPAPERLPGMPKAARQLRGMRQVVARMGGGSSAGGKVLEGMDRGAETLRLSKSPDVAVRVKVFLDYGAVSPKMVAQKVVSVMGGIRGRTFAELIWREYVAVSSHRAVGLKSAASAVRA